MQPRLKWAFFLLGAVSTFPASAVAAEDLTVISDQATVVSLPKAPGTIVVGNPSIADVVLRGQKLLVNGMTFGMTNIIVLDEAGQEIVEYRVSVTQDDPNAMVMFTPGGRESYSCLTYCEPALQIGDSPDFVRVTSGNQQAKVSTARATATSD
jgi:ABC-type Fe3+-hydroxamate transport system substrate-binding protein